MSKRPPDFSATILVHYEVMRCWKADALIVKAPIFNLEICRTTIAGGIKARVFAIPPSPKDACLPTSRRRHKGGEAAFTGALPY
jgi:hypothetical protein